MDLEPEWEEKVAENLLPEEGQKEEKKYLLNIKFIKWLNWKALIKISNL